VKQVFTPSSGDLSESNSAHERNDHVTANSANNRREKLNDAWEERLRIEFNAHSADEAIVTSSAGKLGGAKSWIQFKRKN